MNDIDLENLEKARALVAANSNVRHITIAAIDLNGIPRGKKIPVDQLERAFDGNMRMPLSTLGVDIWGCDVVDSKEVFETGDADGLMRPTERGLIADLSGAVPDLFLPCSMVQDDGEPYGGDPRHALQRTSEELARQGIKAVMATEMEFYLVAPDKMPPAPPDSPEFNRPHEFEHVLSVDALSEFNAFIHDVYKACAEQQIPADSVISEGGPAQFEVNLVHQDDPLKLADDTFLFKRIVKQCARAHGFAASFMAKIYGTEPGNGLHVHTSLVDRQGRNIFDDNSDRGSDALRHAVAGMIETLHDSFLVFAPHINSYRRFRRGTHAPSGIAWGYENRTAAIRIPAAAARREGSNTGLPGRTPIPISC